MRTFEGADYIRQEFIDACALDIIDKTIVEDILSVFDNYREEGEKRGLEDKDRDAFWRSISEIIYDNNAFILWHFERIYRDYETEVKNVSWNVYKMRDFECSVRLEGYDAQWITRDILMPTSPDEIKCFLDNTPNTARRYICQFDSKSRELDKILSDSASWIVNINLYELNYFFKLYSELDEETKRVYEDALVLYRPKKIKDFINLTANLDGICIINDIRDKEELGRFLVENDMFHTQFDNEPLPYLNYEKIAEEHIRTHKGELMDGYYVEDTFTNNEIIEIYDGEHIPDFDIPESEESELKM